MDAHRGWQREGETIAREDVVVAGPIAGRPASRSPGQASAVLQEFAFPPTPEDLHLYLRPVFGELCYSPDKLSTYGAGKLSFNSYFNSFFEAYWVRYTQVRKVSLAIRGRGKLWCDVFRDAAPLGCRSLARVRVDLGAVEEVLIPISLVGDDAGYPGRLFLDIESDGAFELESIKWVTHEPGRRSVRLGVGLCTFNREAYVLRTVETILGASRDASVAAVVVVNQGRALPAEDWRPLLARHAARLKLVEQDNFGGAGGFTRSAIELLDDEEITHVLFMDDDIKVDARSLVVAAAFLRYSTEAVVVGGHMLDLLRRHMLYEAGNAVTSDNLLSPNHHDLDLNQLSSLSVLGRVAPSHFNGWWFAAIPRVCFEKLGLPSPIFIRGDDLEFGVRLHRAGFETVALPPVCVWHEPFYVKPPGWQLYYDMRNRLIFASVHGEMFSLDTPTRLMKNLMVHLIRYDYQTIFWLVSALRDYLRGPELVDEGLPQTHARVTKAGAAWAPERLASRLLLSPAAFDTPRRSWPIRWRMLNSAVRTLTGLVRRRGATGVIAADVPVHWTRLSRSYVLSDREGHFFLRYTYSWRKSVALTSQMVAAVLAYARHRKRVASEWRSAQPDLTSRARWDQILNLQHQAPAKQARAA